MSVLFCDVVGFTAASEGADPEDVRARMERYYGGVRAEIERFGGTVEKFIGDAVMAVFGAPIAHEDDAERAVRAGLAILAAIGDLNDLSPDLALSVRVGVNTGEVLVSLGQFADGSSSLVLGDVVNTAARIQSAAPVDGVAASEETYRRTERVFVWERFATVAAKGKSQPLHIWQARKPRGPVGLNLMRLQTTPFVGRESERAQLEELFSRCAGKSSPQVVTLVGEPGAGKSRLLAELSASLTTQHRMRWRQGRCLPYGDGISFWALGEIVKSEAGIFDSDSSELAAKKLEAVLPAGAGRPWLRARLLPLVGVESGQPTSRDELFAAWRGFLEHLAADAPTVVAIEDLHWADSALLDFLTYLAAQAGPVPLLVICTARPEVLDRFPAGLGGPAEIRTVTLNPLSDGETIALVASLLQWPLSQPLKQSILERAGGNPLYAEELVQLLSERSFPHEAVLSLPESLQALIAARLDNLPHRHKKLLQDAAIIGTTFWAGALQKLGRREPQELERDLNELSRRAFVRPAPDSSLEGETAYSFSHVLVRDVAYAQIPRVDRVQRHRAAAVWIERSAGSRIEDSADLLAHHYLQALDLARALGDVEQAAQTVVPARRFLALAGARSLGLDTAQAEARFAHALELTPGDDPARSSLLVCWANAAADAGRHREAAAALDEALPTLLANGNPTPIAAALLQQSRAAWALGQPRHLALAAEAVALLERQEPGALLVEAISRLSIAQRSTGSKHDAVATAERALALAAELGLPEPASALADHGIARAELGEREGIAELEHALALLIEQGAGREAAVAMNNLAYVRYPIDGHTAALAAFEAGLAFAAPRGLTEITAVFEQNMLEDLVALGRSAQALQIAARLAATVEEGGDTAALTGIRCVEATVHAARGEQDAALQHTDWLIETARASGQIELLVHGLASAAIAEGTAGNHQKARALLNELEQNPAARTNLNYPSLLPAMVRTALATSDLDLAQRLTHDVDTVYPLQQHALRTSHAQLAEAAGNHQLAVTLYADAADRWHDFGDQPEHAYAVLGQGRCLTNLHHPDAHARLTQARRLFTTLGYKSALDQTTTLLTQTTAQPRIGISST